MTTIQTASPFPTLAVIGERVRALSGARVRTLAAVLVSLVAPGVGTAVRGQVRRGLLIFAGFVASAFVPVPALAVVAMASFWVLGMVSALPLPGDD